MLYWDKGGWICNCSFRADCLSHYCRDWPNAGHPNRDGWFVSWGHRAPIKSTETKRQKRTGSHQIGPNIESGWLGVSNSGASESIVRQKTSKCRRPGSPNARQWVESQPEIWIAGRPFLGGLFALLCYCCWSQTQIYQMQLESANRQKHTHTHTL